jgi:hypothetical protein
LLLLFLVDWLGAAGLVIDRALVFFSRKEKCFVFVGMPFCGDALLLGPAKNKTLFFAGEPQKASSRGSLDSSDFRRRFD